MVGRNVLDGRWTFQIVEEFDDGYWSIFREHERRVRDELQQGARHVFEAEMKERTADQGSARPRSRHPYDSRRGYCDQASTVPPPPDVPLSDIDLGSWDFWALDDDVRDGAFATLRREAPVSLPRVFVDDEFDPGRGALGGDPVRRRLLRQQAPRDLQLGAAGSPSATRRPSWPSTSAR